jgi:hypothetical protein
MRTGASGSGPDGIGIAFTALTSGDVLQLGLRAREVVIACDSGSLRVNLSSTHTTDAPQFVAGAGLVVPRAPAWRWWRF